MLLAFPFISSMTSTGHFVHANLLNVRFSQISPATRKDTLGARRFCPDKAPSCYPPPTLGEHNTVGTNYDYPSGWTCQEAVRRKTLAGGPQRHFQQYGGSPSQGRPPQSCLRMHGPHSRSHRSPSQPS